MLPPFLFRRVLSSTRALLLAPVLLLAAPHAPALAQASADDRAAADALFDAARKLMDEGKYDKACPKFRDSYDLDPGVGTLLNLALCYKQAGRTASAWTVYREAAAAARKDGQTEREELARQEAQALEKVLTRLVIEVSPEASEIPDLMIRRGDQTIKQTLWGVPVPLDPGNIQIETSAPGYETRTDTVAVAGAGKTVQFVVQPLQKTAGSLVPAETPPADAAPAAEESSPPSEGKPQAEAGELPRKRSALPWVLGGVGVAAAGAGTVLAFLSRSDYQASTEICSNYPEEPCSATDVQDHEKLKNSTRAKAIGAYVGWGVGGAALIGAGILFLTQSKATQRDRAMKFEPLFTRDGFGLITSGHF